MRHLVAGILVLCLMIGGAWVAVRGQASNFGGGGGVSTTAANTYGAFLQDFSAATVKVPTAAGFTATANSMIGYDSTATQMRFWTQGFAGTIVGENGNLPVNTIPKQQASTPYLIASSILDSGTTVSTTEQIVSTLATGTAPFTVASTTPVATLTVSNHPKMQFCGTTSTCSATALTTAQLVVGSAPLVSGTPSTVTITGISPAFASSTSYDCNITDETNAANNLLKVVNVSGSSFTITGPATNTDTISYVCAGN